MPALFEKVRPHSLAEVVGQSAAVAVAQRIIDCGAGGQCVLIAGPSGNGKTTIARIIAESIATGPYWIEEGDASRFSASRLDDIAQESRQYGGGKGGRAYIVNECHGLRADQLRRLDVMTEKPELRDHVCWIFTTTTAGEESLFEGGIDAVPFASRLLKIKLTNQGTAQAFATRAREIAQAAGLDGQPESAYLSLVRKHKGNFRAVLRDIEAGCMLAEVGAA